MAKNDKKVPGLRVVAAQDGFRRGGRAWSKEPTDVALSDLSREQIAQIKAEPKLAVTEVDVVVGAANDSGSGADDAGAK